jgi:hypothetical protein
VETEVGVGGRQREAGDGVAEWFDAFDRAGAPVEPASNGEGDEDADSGVQ